MGTPEKINAGLNAEWEVDGGDYPASDGYTLSYALVNSAGQIVFDADADGDDYLIELDAATTADYTAGIYKYQVYVTLSDDKYLVEEGTIEVLPDFAAASDGLDTRSHVKTVLDAIEATIAGRAAKGQKKMQVNGVNLERYDLAELLLLRTRYKAEYANELKLEKIENGENVGGVTLIRFD